MSIFRFALGKFRRGSDGIVAVPIVVRYVSCPYCGSFFPMLALGSVSSRLHRERYGRDGGPSPGYRASHLGNPVECPSCRGKFVVFVGIEGDVGEDLRVRDIHVDIAKADEPFVESLTRWPHRGLVDKRVIEYTPGVAEVYDDLEHYMAVRGDLDTLLNTSSLPADVASKRGDESVGRRSARPPSRVALGRI